MGGERGAEVLPLARAGRAGAQLQRDVVARALELGRDALRFRGELRAGDAGDEHAPARRLRARAAAARAAAGR